MEKRVYLLIAVSILIIVGLVGLADLSELQSILSSADIGMVFLSILSYTLAIVVFALIWHFLLKATELKLSMTNNLKLVFSAVFFNVVTPTASYGGEAVRAYLLSKKFKLSAGKGVATIVAHRIIGTISNSLGTLALSMYLIVFYDIPTFLLAIIGFVTFSSFFGFLIVLYFGLRIEWSKGVMEKLFRIVSRFKKVKADSKKSAFESLESYHDGLKVLLKSRGTLLLALLMGLLAWFFVNLVAIFAFMGVGGSVDMENFLLIFTFFSVSRLIPTGLPEFVGSKEAILAAMYSASGLPVSTSVAVIILIRLATQLWMVLLGGAITLELGFKGFNADG
jgi:uncharacterized protein (TIRG00374 family)